MVPNMRKLFSDRNLVVILFVVAFIVFSFAQEDAKKIERAQMQASERQDVPVKSSPDVHNAASAARD